MSVPRWTVCSAMARGAPGACSIPGFRLRLRVCPRTRRTAFRRWKKPARWGFRRHGFSISLPRRSGFRFAGSESGSDCARLLEKRLREARSPLRPMWPAFPTRPTLRANSDARSALRPHRACAMCGVSYVRLQNRCKRAKRRLRARSDGACDLGRKVLIFSREQRQVPVARRSPPKAGGRDELAALRGP